MSLGSVDRDAGIWNQWPIKSVVVAHLINLDNHPGLLHWLIAIAIAPVSVFTTTKTESQPTTDEHFPVPQS